MLSINPTSVFLPSKPTFNTTPTFRCSAAGELSFPRWLQFTSAADASIGGASIPGWTRTRWRRFRRWREEGVWGK
ncbi:hypothetical protein OIU79_014311 [Salix purpurea]|uniref:Uncharacterized protein n=1 Tax=Salix purpurea TaxID=77065 RepID=A0A9Q0PR84_SALPP|nr:hypothetical protein OIU79_014311 [Salix purpurea]